MPEVKVHNLRREEVGAVDLPEGAYDYPYKRHLLYEAVRHYLAVGRAGTHKAKNRVDVRGGGRKPWRQKGTGRARVGSIRSPLWRGGGTIHGPLPRDYSYRFPKKARRRALASALSDKLREGQLIVVDEWQLEQPKTKALVGLVRGELKIEGKVLLVHEGGSEAFERAARNHPEIGFIRAMQLHAYHVLDHETLVMSRAAAEQLGEVLTR
jgi:large subunit ribosomal protein L4